MASDIGLLAKGDALGRLTVAATSLRSAQPLAGARVTLDRGSVRLADGTLAGSALTPAPAPATR